MSLFSRIAASFRPATFTVNGDAITYVPDGGTGVPIQTTCIVGPPVIGESSPAKYFADIQVDPAVIPYPQRKDGVELAGVFYEVAKVDRPHASSMWALAIHRKFDP